MKAGIAVLIAGAVINLAGIANYVLNPPPAAAAPAKGYALVMVMTVGETTSEHVLRRVDSMGACWDRLMLTERAMRQVDGIAVEQSFECVRL
jgi:hypothetical protein